MMTEMNNTNNNINTDALSRRRIVSETDENFFVEAGAGSGKTTMLVNRMAAMVENGIDISKICAITFTKAAAGEFYDRFQKLLMERSQGPGTATPEEFQKEMLHKSTEELSEEFRNEAPHKSAQEQPEEFRNEAPHKSAQEQPEEFKKEAPGSKPSSQEETEERWPGSLPEPTRRTRELCRNALQNIDLCFMGTIDSFCSLLLSEHPSEAGIPSDAHIVSDEDAAAIYRQEYVKISSGEYGSKLQAMAGTFQAVHRGAQDVFVRGMTFIMNNRNAHFNYHEAGMVDIDKDFAHEREQILSAVKCLLEHPELKYGGNNDSRVAWDRLPDSYKTLRRRWSRNYTGVLYALKSVKGLRLIPEAMNHHAVTLSPLFEPGGKSKKPKWLQYKAAGESGAYERLLRLQYDASMTLLVNSIPVIEAVMREKGNLTFFDYLYYLRNMLRRDALGDGKLIRYIYERHSYFLIDEFQDTNPMQAEVFFYLSAENPVGQWSECVPRKGSLFIVGDPKQSIYRFRSADVTSFLRVRNLFEKQGGAILSLSRNFRSTRVLCEYFNRQFDKLLHEETVNQSKFEKIPLPEPSENEFTGVFSYEAYTGSAAADHPSETDPVRIADMIEGIVNREEYKLRTPGDTRPRPVRYSDFMVITYGKKKLGPIMAELDKRGIPTKVEGAVPFPDNEALVEISKLFSAVADTDDAIALYSALTGRLMGVDREEVLRYKSHGGTVSFTAKPLPEDRADRAAVHVSEKIGQLKDLHSKALRLSPAALFSRIMDDFRVYQIVSAENMEVVYYALELLRNAERSGTVISLKDGAAFLKGLISGASDEERCLSLDAGRDCVHMANLHKVKGLEAPIVILAEAKQGTFPAEYRINHEDTGSTGWVFSMKSEWDENGRSTTYFQTEDYPDESAAEKEALAAEEKRLIYVGATRARNVLVLCDRIAVIRGSEVHNSKWKEITDSGLRDLWEELRERDAETSAADEEESASDEEVRTSGEEKRTSGEEKRTSHLSPAEETEEAHDSAAAAAALLYRSAEETSALNDRSSENASFEIRTPSHLDAVSKLAEADLGESPENIVETAEAETAQAAESAAKPDKTQAAKPEKAQGITAQTAESEKAQTDSGLGVHEIPALLGTTVHRLMEMLVSAGGQVDAQAAVGEILREYITPETEPYEQILEKALLKVARTMRNGGYAQANGLPQDILRVLLAADEVHCELPFCYLDKDSDEKTVWNGVMDVVYLSEGKWHIVDYKTNADGSDLDLKYQGQMAAYIKAFKAITGQDADARTYHIDI